MSLAAHGAGPFGGAFDEERFLVDSGHGYRLALRRVTRSSARGGATGRPVLLVPGYGMNSFILGHHPSGRSLVHVLAEAGLETWTADLRGQGSTLRAGGARRYGLAELALEDVPAAVRAVLARTATDASSLDLVGVSLGTALVYAYLTAVPDAPVHAVASLGGLVTWTEVPPLVALAFASPRLVARVRLRKTRTLARFALPALARLAPGLLGIYLNPGSTDVSDARLLVQTVEDPHPGVNADIARWVLGRELVVRGVNVSQRMRALTHPQFTAVALDDGIVPAATARAVHEATSASRKVLLEVGGGARRIAHGDLLLAHGIDDEVFAPLAAFLRDA